MADDTPGISADFATSFKAFLDRAVAQTPEKPGVFVERLRDLFGADPATLPIIGEQFQVPDHPNLQRALDAYLADGRSHEILGVIFEPYSRGGLAELLVQRGGGQGPQPGPVEYVNVSLEEDVLPCIQSGLFLVTGPGGPLAAFARGPNESSFRANVQIEVMAPQREAAEAFLAELRRRMRERNVYRGRVLSLFVDEMRALRVAFHRLGRVERDAIVLPDGLLERVERQTTGFSRHAERLRALGRHLRRGMLLYGPPGTGKTLLTRYVINAMEGRTVLLVTGGGMGLIPQACAMARALQPAIVVLEDVDLVAEERTRQNKGCNAVLFELLNEMDGLEEDADVVFILTTNRADLLEPALASRPGRVDQAFEVPAPDAKCRARLFELYGRGLDLPPADVEAFVKRTGGVSAAFIRELLRRAALFAADETSEARVESRHVDEALHELVVQGGELTRSLLGAGPPAPGRQD
jgi:cell division protease FtsH